MEEMAVGAPPKLSMSTTVLAYVILFMGFIQPAPIR
jgi:hypothetical protein